MLELHTLPAARTCLNQTKLAWETSQSHQHNLYCLQRVSIIFLNTLNYQRPGETFFCVLKGMQELANHLENRQRWVAKSDPDQCCQHRFSKKYPIGTSKMGAPRHCNECAEGEKKTDSCYGSKARSKRQKANQITRRLTRGSWLPCQKRPEPRWKGSNHEAGRKKSRIIVICLYGSPGFGVMRNLGVKVEKVKAQPRMAHCQMTQRAVGGRPARSHVAGQQTKLGTVVLPHHSQTSQVEKRVERTVFGRWQRRSGPTRRRRLQPPAGWSVSLVQHTARQYCGGSFSDLVVCSCRSPISSRGGQHWANHQPYEATPNPHVWLHTKFKDQCLNIFHVTTCKWELPWCISIYRVYIYIYIYISLSLSRFYDFPPTCSVKHTGFRLEAKPLIPGSRINVVHWTRPPILIHFYSGAYAHVYTLFFYSYKL